MCVSVVLFFGQLFWSLGLFLLSRWDSAAYVWVYDWLLMMLSGLLLIRVCLVPTVFGQPGELEQLACPYLEPSELVGPVEPAGHLEVEARTNDLES